MESGRDWSTDEDDPTDNPEPGSSLSKKSSSRKRKAGRLVKSRISKSSKLKRNYESNESGPSWNGTNTRTLITAITKNKDIVHDFKKIIDSKITGKPVHVEELKSVAEPVGTRSTVQVENVVEGRVVKSFEVVCPAVHIVFYISDKRTNRDQIEKTEKFSKIRSASFWEKYNHICES